MAKGPTLEEHLARLSGLRAVPDAAERRKALAEALASRSSLAAARALAHVGAREGALPLRVKLLAGDAEPAVMAECFVAVLKLSLRESLPFVDRFLDSADDAVREAAAAALGGTRDRGAYELL